MNARAAAPSSVGVAASVPDAHDALVEQLGAFGSAACELLALLMNKLPELLSCENPIAAYRDDDGGGEPAEPLTADEISVEHLSAWWKASDPVMTLRVETADHESVVVSTEAPATVLVFRRYPGEAEAAWRSLMGCFGDAAESNSSATELRLSLANIHNLMNELTIPESEPTSTKKDTE